MPLRRVARLVLGGILLLASPLMAAPLPQVTGPIPVTATSRPFLGAGEAMAAAGYVEEEYFLSGQAKVYDWVGSTTGVKVVAAPGAYTTRILVRRPRDPARFGGNVQVTVLNASRGVDLGAPLDFERLVRQGDVWIGVTSKAITANALKSFDPVRYAPLNWSNPAPAAARCPRPTIISMYSYGGEEVFTRLNPRTSAPETEDGLIWDMLGQLGLLLKSDQREKILPGFGKPWVFMDGVSQSGTYMRTWLVAFHDRYRTPDGKPVYDGYLEIVGPATTRINQCSADVAIADPRNKLLPPPDVPYVSLATEGEMWLGKYTHQPDAVTRTGGIVTYQVAGASHEPHEIPGRPHDQIGMASPEDLARAGLRMPSGMTSPPAGLTPNDFPWAPVLRGAYHNLELWVRQGTPPPQAPGIALDDSLAIRRDRYGNALGGVRMPYIDVPTASYLGAPGDGPGLATLLGAHTPFSAETLKAAYPDHATYVAKFSAATDRMAADRWISAEDAAAMKAAAEAAAAPH